jgi:hypothetical protein
MTADTSIKRQQFSEFVADCIPAHSLVSTKNIPFVSSNTQARRLGCLIFILNKIVQGEKTERLLFLASQKELTELRQHLEAFSKSTGILTNNISSFRHYLELAESLSFVVKQGAVYQLSNDGQLLLRTRSRSHFQPYPLHSATSAYLFQSIFAKDLIGLFPLIQYLLRNGKSSQQILIGKYHKEVLNMLHNLQEQSDARSRQVFQTKIRDVNQWTKPASYSEHLVSSKLNWLIDLELIEGSPSSCSCTDGAKSLFGDFLDDIPRNLIDILYLSLQYALSISKDTTTRPFDETLKSIFQIAGAETNFAKIRIQDAIRLLIAYYPTTFKQLALTYGTMANAVQNGAREQYQIQTSQRHSQAYIFQLKET